MSNQLPLCLSRHLFVLKNANRYKKEKLYVAFHVGIIHCPNIATNILKALVRKKQHVAEFCEPEGILRTREGMLQREFCEPEKGEFWVHVILRRLVPVVKKHMWLYEWRRNATSSYSSVCGYSFCSCHNYFFIVNASQRSQHLLIFILETSFQHTSSRDSTPTPS